MCARFQKRERSRSFNLLISSQKILEVLFPANIYEVYYSPSAKAAVYVKDDNGNEQFQIYAYDPSSRRATQISDGKSRNTEPVWSNKGDWVIYSSNRRNGTDTDLYIAKPSEPNTTRLLAHDKGYLKVFDWSPDDHKALFYNWLSANESYLYIVDVTSGEKVLLTPNTGAEKVSYDYAQFSAHGRGIYLPHSRQRRACGNKIENLLSPHAKYARDGSVEDTYSARPLIFLYSSLVAKS